MEVKNLQNQKGFTLVEIAIVLVIIGLLLGGVLKGQELIENSKVKSVIQDFDGITAAAYAYRDRTGLSAGDDNKDGTFVAAEFWQELRTEGFINGDAADGTGPSHSLDGAFSFVAGDVAANAMFVRNHICASGIEDVVAENIDNKLDDGDATTGQIRSGTTDAATAAYTNTGAAPFFVCREL